MHFATYAKNKIHFGQLFVIHAAKQPVPNAIKTIKVSTPNRTETQYDISLTNNLS